MPILKNKSQAIEDTGHTVMNRVTGNAATNIVAADINAITYTSHDLKTGEQTSGTLTIGTVVFDTLQKDVRWTKDTSGYNFRWTIPASELPEGDRTKEFEITFDPISGEDFVIIREVDILGLKGS